jgi:hypothetical protein
LGRKIQVHHNTVKKFFDKDGSPHCKAKKSTPKTTARQQSVIKARLKLLTQNLFSEKSIYKCVMEDESHFTVDGNEWQQQSYYESEDHSAKVWLWLAVSENSISEPVFFKAGLAVNKKVYKFWPDLAI